jgi:hypothetical protein
MVSTVRPRPNYYEVLGLTATATIEEIRHAFASRTSLFQRPLADTAELAVAFETLRDPAKREAYDIERGLKPAPPPAPPKPPEVHVSVNFIGAMAPRPDPVARPAAAERSVGSVIASSLREPAPAPAAPQRRGSQPAEIPAFLRSAKNQLVIDEPTFEWKRPAIALGGVILGVGVLAAVAGWSAGLVDERDQVEGATTVPLPKPKSRAASVAAEPSAALPQGIVAARNSAPAPVIAAARTRHDTPSRPEPAAELPDPFANVPVAEASEADAAPVEAAAATVESQPAVQSEPASMPLPNSVIARTIGRIGYACGSVASTAPVDGASGVFKVTCTSGHSYQATPVHGRYHFRRLSDR